MPVHIDRRPDVSTNIASVNWSESEGEILAAPMDFVAAGAYMVHLENISRCYGLAGRRVQALRDIGVFIPAGQFVSIVGPFGLGKSTLLNILGCLDRPTGGTYWLDGALDIAAHAQRRIHVRDGKIESDHAA